MSQRSTAPRESTATKIRFVGPPDHYLPGLAQGELLIGIDITLQQAHEAVASGLYEPIDGALAPLLPASHAPLPANETATAAAAPEEV